MSNITHRVSSNDTPSDSDVDRRQVEALDEAEGLLGRFVQPEDLTPRTCISIDDLAAEKAAQAGMDASDPDDLLLAARSIQNVLKERCVAELTRLDRVCLDLSDETGGKGYLSFDIPSIVFCAVRSGDGLIQRHAPDPTSKVRALAVYFDPTLVGRRTFTSRATGELVAKPDVYDPNGYVAIVSTFTTVAEAEQARDELSQAVRQIQRDVSDTAGEDDPIRSLDVDQGRSRPAALDTL